MLATRFLGFVHLPRCPGASLLHSRHGVHRRAGLGGHGVRRGAGLHQRHCARLHHGHGVRQGVGLHLQHGPGLGHGHRISRRVGLRCGAC